jgi:hypothetical protein
VQRLCGQANRGLVRGRGADSSATTRAAAAVPGRARCPAAAATAQQLWWELLYASTRLQHASRLPSGARTLCVVPRRRYGVAEVGKKMDAMRFVFVPAGLLPAVVGLSCMALMQRSSPEAAPKCPQVCSASRMLLLAYRPSAPVGVSNEMLLAAAAVAATAAAVAVTARCPLCPPPLLHSKPRPRLTLPWTLATWPRGGEHRRSVVTHEQWTEVTSLSGGCARTRASQVRRPESGPRQEAMEDGLPVPNYWVKAPYCTEGGDAWPPRAHARPCVRALSPWQGSPGWDVARAWAPGAPLWGGATGVGASVQGKRTGMRHAMFRNGSFRAQQRAGFDGSRGSAVSTPCCPPALLRLS